MPAAGLSYVAVSYLHTAATKVGHILKERNTKRMKQRIQKKNQPLREGGGGSSPPYSLFLPFPCGGGVIVFPASVSRGGDKAAFVASAVVLVPDWFEIGDPLQ